MSRCVAIDRDSYWPSGVLAEKRPPRDVNTKQRTRVVAKAKMLGTIDDELKSFLGSDTTRRGVLRIFNMFQHATLNRRLVYVIVEGMIRTLLSDNQFADVFHKLHSRSPRVQKLMQQRGKQLSSSSTTRGGGGGTASAGSGGGDKLTTSMTKVASKSAGGSSMRTSLSTSTLTQSVRYRKS